MKNFMDIEFVTSGVHPMFRRAADKIEKYHGGYVFVVFEMGSVKLDIDDPQNRICFYFDYVDIFNNENGETTLIRCDQIKGFVFENKPVHIEDDEEV